MNNQFTEMPRGFKGIWIPREIWLHKELTCFEKNLWAEIHSLDNDESGCTASNEYLCNFFNIQEKTLQRGLAKLKNLGYIKVEKFDGRIRVLRASIKDIFVTSAPTSQNDKDKFDTSDRTNLTPLLTGSYIEEIKEERIDSVPLPEKGDEPILTLTEDERKAKEICEYLFDLILKSYPKAKEPNMKNWMSDLLKIYRIDKNSFDEIKEMITWAHEDKFWYAQIRSPNSLREYWEKMYLQKCPPSNKGTLTIANRSIAEEIRGALGPNDRNFWMSATQAGHRGLGDALPLEMDSVEFEKILMKWFNLERD